jgi:hypothetical protein
MKTKSCRRKAKHGPMLDRPEAIGMREIMPTKSMKTWFNVGLTECSLKTCVHVEYLGRSHLRGEQTPNFQIINQRRETKGKKGN